MLLGSILLGALSVAASVVPVPREEIEHELMARQNSFVIQNWGNDKANYTFNSGQAGAFRLNWDQPSGGNFVVGKGYRPGVSPQVQYSGTFQTNGNSYLALYGWTQNPLVEWYVIENFGTHHPADNRNSTCYGTFESDGGTYEVWMKWRVNSPSIIGTATFPQFWSVRTKRRIGGSVNTTRHFEAYTKAGLKLGRFLDTIVGIEGQTGKGSANLTVGVAPATKAAETATPTIRTERPSQTATCTPKL
jgi:endo-1,4-beta-xylanase